MEFSRQEYWSGLPFPSPGDLLDPGIEPGSSALQADSSPSESSGKPLREAEIKCPTLDTSNIFETKFYSYLIDRLLDIEFSLRQERFLLPGPCPKFEGILLYCLPASTACIEESILILDSRYLTVFFFSLQNLLKHSLCEPEFCKDASWSGSLATYCRQDLGNSFTMENRVGQLGIFLILFLWQHLLLHSHFCNSRNLSCRMLSFLGLLSHFCIFFSPIFHLFVFFVLLFRQFPPFQSFCGFKKMFAIIFLIFSRFKTIFFFGCYFLIASNFNSWCLWMQYHLLPLENFN